MLSATRLLRWLLVALSFSSLATSTPPLPSPRVDSLMVTLAGWPPANGAYMREPALRNGASLWTRTDDDGVVYEISRSEQHRRVKDGEGAELTLPAQPMWALVASKVLKGSCA